MKQHLVIWNSRVYVCENWQEARQFMSWLCPVPSKEMILNYKCVSEVPFTETSTEFIDFTFNIIKPVLKPCMN
jgi:hypothetical protein